MLNAIKYQELMPDPFYSWASATLCDDSTATPPNPVRQNAGPILAFDGFKRVISVIKYQEFMLPPLTIRIFSPWCLYEEPPTSTLHLLHIPVAFGGRGENAVGSVQLHILASQDI